MQDVASADQWFADREEWHDEVAVLREIVRSTGLTETLKWKQPCYTDHGKNIVIVSWLKRGAVASFLKGALLDDPRGRLEQPGEHARSARFVVFSSVDAVHADRAYLEALIQSAIQVERAGLRVPPLPDEIDYVDELRERMAADAEFREAFERLTPGRRRAYNFHFAKAKRSATRVSRIDKCTERIRMGKGLLDCICGRSKRMPRCDGSHKHDGRPAG